MKNRNHVPPCWSRARRDSTQQKKASNALELNSNHDDRKTYSAIDYFNLKSHSQKKKKKKIRKSIKT